MMFSSNKVAHIKKGEKNENKTREKEKNMKRNMKKVAQPMSKAVKSIIN